MLFGFLHQVNEVTLMGGQAERLALCFTVRWNWSKGSQPGFKVGIRSVRPFKIERERVTLRRNQAEEGRRTYSKCSNRCVKFLPLRFDRRLCMIAL
jgi:hypothetical protein